MFDITRVVVVRAMTIAANSNTETRIPLGDNIAKTEPWIHKEIDCGHYQEIPLDATEVKCENCNELVKLVEDITTKEKQNLPRGQYNILTGELIKSEQPQLNFSKLDVLESQRIHGRNKLTKYIPKGTVFRSVGYDWNCNMILEIIKDNEYEKSTIIIGYNMSGSNDDETTLLALHDYIEEQKLEIRIPKKGGPWHEKFFFIEGTDDKTEQPFWIDVNGSSNPTFHGSGKKGGQSNRITRVGFVGNFSHEEYVKKSESDWKWYMDNSEPFEGELFELLNKIDREDRVKTITRYYSGDISILDESERTPVEILRAHVGGELLKVSTSGQKVIKMELSDYSIDTVDTFISEMADLGFSTRPSIDGTVELPVSLLDSTKYTTENIPYMKIDEGSLVLRAQGETFIRTNRKFDSTNIANQLEKIESYVETMDNSHLPGLKTKMALSEYLLSGLCAPFDSLWMDIRKSRYKRVTEGPQMTSYFGGSGNGKSYASRYLLKMITGLDLEPLSSDDFTEKRVRGVAKNGSCMPMIFDDLKRNRILEWDTWGKFFWERGHVLGQPHSQLLVTANDRINSQGNLGRRVREIWMEATFENNGANTETVESCLENCSDIFQYFSAIVIDMYFDKAAPYEHLDPLKVGRIAIDQLYKIAEREKPRWWCPLPYSDCVDANAYFWFDILNKELFIITRKLDSFSIEIEEAAHEINNRLKTFPAHLQAKKAGKAISVNNADGMIEWLRKVSHLYSEEKGKPTRRMRRLLRKGV
jgi:hypothetical protein